MFNVILTIFLILMGIILMSVVASMFLAAMIMRGLDNNEQESLSETDWTATDREKNRDYRNL